MQTRFSWSRLYNGIKSLFFEVVFIFAFLVILKFSKCIFRSDLISMISKAGASEPVGPPKFCFIWNERNSLSKVVLFWPTRLFKHLFVLLQKILRLIFFHAVWVAKHSLHLLSKDVQKKCRNIDSLVRCGMKKRGFANTY